MKEKGQGLRFNSDKLRYELMNPAAVKGMVQVLTAGANKYAERNWELGMKWSTVIASLKRHLALIEAGEDYDKETGLLHADHLQCNAHFLSAYYEIYPEGDDRPNTFFNKKVALDIDGVIADFGGAIKNRNSIDNEPTAWYYSYKFKDTNMWQDLQRDKNFWVNDIQPYFDGSQLPFEPIAYVTHRHIPVEWCEEWLEKHNFPCVPVHVVGGSKAAVLKEIGAEIFVDDKYDNFAELNNSGIFTYLYDQLWNRRYDVGHKRIYSLNEIVKR